MDPNSLKRDIVQKGVESLLDAHQVPARQLLKVLQQLHEEIAQHKADLSREREAAQKHQKHLSDYDSHVSNHEGKLSKWGAQLDDFLSKDWTGEKGEQGAMGPAGKSAETVDLDKIIAAVRAQVKDGENGKNGENAKIDHEAIKKIVIDALLKDQPLAVGNIRGLQEYISQRTSGFMYNGQRYGFEELMHGAGSSGSTGASIYNEVVSGSGTSWTLANTPKSGTLRLYGLGQRLVPTTNYTISGATITTSDSWAAGALTADYSK